jgi:hypothetical protein
MPARANFAWVFKKNDKKGASLPVATAIGTMSARPIPVS